MGAKETKFFNPELCLTEEEESERQRLEKELDQALEGELLSKKKQGECWAALRPLYSKPGCKSQWGKFVKSKGAVVSTVNGLIKRLNDGWSIEIGRWAGDQTVKTSRSPSGETLGSTVRPSTLSSLRGWEPSFSAT